MPVSIALLFVPMLLVTLCVTDRWHNMVRFGSSFSLILSYKGLSAFKFCLSWQLLAVRGGKGKQAEALINRLGKKSWPEAER